jgi:hypothetical protein
MCHTGGYRSADGPEHPSTAAALAQLDAAVHALLAGGPASPRLALPPAAYQPALRRLYALQADPAAEAAAAHVRVVLLPADKLASLAELAWTLAQHPRSKFIVFCPSIPAKAELGAALSTFGDGASWPANALLVNGQLDLPPAAAPAAN